MIKNISELKKFGIFQNHTSVSPDGDFGKYNLFFGWNGSGKSTLSDVFRCMENKAVTSRYANSEFTVNICNGNTINQSNIAESSQNVYTFNRDFIDENISWDSIVKSILLVDKEKIEERIKLEKLKEQQLKDNTTHEREVQKIEKNVNAISKFGTISARHIKSSLRAINTKDSYFLNYDKTKFNKFIEKNIDAIKSNEGLLDEEQIKKLTDAAKPDQKPSIAFNPKTIDSEKLIKEIDYLNNLLRTSVISQTIDRLIEQGEIKDWVETGIDIHKQHNSTRCEFCGNTITEERKEELEAHFNDDYKEFTGRIEKAFERASELKFQSPGLPHFSDFYGEFTSEYDKSCNSLVEAIDAFNGKISALQEVFAEKIKNPLNTELSINTISDSLIDAVNEAIRDISKIVDTHNHKSEHFKEEVEIAKKQLELHYATILINEFEFYDKNQKVTDRTEKNKAFKISIEATKDEIGEIEDSLFNEKFGADQFNKSLKKFLGRSDLTLQFNQEEKGYEILRNDSKLADGHLSEGEKTAIAFVYFITKLKENDNNIEETIVVIDDPISSFDSNHLFCAYDFLKMHCENAKQLFVLTHNFTFFKLVRHWILLKNRFDKEHPSKLYEVKANNQIPRNSTFVIAGKTLERYNSQYHYIFSKLYAFKDQDGIENDDHFLAANLARSLLEAFLSFKFPKDRGNFTNLFNYAVSASKNSEDGSKGRILKFINEYSHYDLIEMTDDFGESQMGECVSVVSAIFEWIEELDEKHYQEMIKVI